MKFAKQLQTELVQEWYTQYIDYKLMKKALKVVDSSDATEAFCRLLEREILKVHSFMQGRQKAIKEDICPLELRPAVEFAGLQFSLEDLVQTIENFRNFAALNQMALRKIIKKFDKRFQVSFIDSIGLPDTSQMLVSNRDVSTWLLDPAVRCLRLIHSSTSISRCLSEKKFHFWLEELRAGVHLSALRVQGRGQALGGPLQTLLIRLGRDGGTSHQSEVELRECENHRSWRIRNTFIDHDFDETAPRTQRSQSVPPRGSMPALCHDTAEEEQQSSAMTIFDEQMRWSPSHEPLDEGSRHGDWHSSDHMFSNHFALLAASEDCTSDLASGSSSLAHSGRRGGGKGSRSASSKWWADVTEACPISGFLISLLPYPPFKFVQSSGNCLVDGPFLVLQVLSSWCFVVLGRPLSMSDIASLDAYMKRCKLGPFRLGRALELGATETREAQQELAALRSKARRKLEGLKHIQKARLGRGPADVAQPSRPKRTGQN